MIYSHQFELFPEEKIIIQPYACLKGVHIASVFKHFKELGINAAFLNPKLIISVKHILIAMNKALSIKSTMNEKGNTADIIKTFFNCLKPEKAPKDLEFDFYFKEGPGPGILVLNCPVKTEVNLKEIIHAQPEMFEDIGCFADITLLQKVYGVEKKELDLDNDIRASIYNQIVLKNR